MAPAVSAEGALANLVNKFVLFVDFHGVIHVGAPGPAWQENLRNFESIFREPLIIENVRIVLCGDWRRRYSWEKLREKFSPDIRPLVIDETPRLQATIGFRSHVEIYAWLKQHPEISDYKVFEWGGFSGEEPYLESALFFPGEKHMSVEMAQALQQIFLSKVVRPE